MSRAPGRVAIIGAGPAGLTAARHLVREGRAVTVLESDQVVGGLSRTVERDGWRFDIGGHRFFSRSAEVMAIWREILGPEDFLERSRLSRIHFDGQYFDYPLDPGNIFRKIGPAESALCLASFAWARLSPPPGQDHFEGWVSARFGRRLYEKFFRAYTEKVWGVPADQIDADWAAQRIKGMSLADAAKLTARARRRDGFASLIDRFHYPRLGPGMMWEACRAQVESGGGEVITGTRVEGIARGPHGASAILARTDGRSQRFEADAVISSMPLGQLVESMDPAAPAEVRAAARALRHRDFLTVAVVVPDEYAFPDNWIYIHSPEVHVGRIQNYRAWSPDMVPTGAAGACLGLEYFVNAGDDLWSMADADLIAMAGQELAHLGIAPSSAVSSGYVVRMPLAYPLYDHGYRERVATIRAWLEREVPNVVPAGRNGMHRYNNQDHAMLTGIAAARRVSGDRSDPWLVNSEARYLEERQGPTGTRLVPAPA